MSIIIGLDDSGAKVHARDAIPGKVYTCPLCGAEMYARKRPSDKADATFVCAHNVRHGEKWCINRSGQQHRVYDLKRFDSEHFFKYILTAPPETAKNTAPERTDETDMFSIFDITDARDENSGEQTDDQIKDGDDVKVSRVTSLKSMWDAGLYACDPRTHLGGKKLTDTLISSRGFSAFSGNRIQGYRVIQARVDEDDQHECRDDDKLWIRFLAMHKSDKAWERKIIIMFFRDKSQYTQAVRYLFNKTTLSSGATDWMAAHKSVLIAGNWDDCDKWKCYHGKCTKKAGCGNCYGLLTANYASSRQIYASDEPTNICEPQSRK